MIFIGKPIQRQLVQADQSRLRAKVSWRVKRCVSKSEASKEVRTNESVPFVRRRSFCSKRGTWFLGHYEEWYVRDTTFTSVGAAT